MLGICRGILYHHSAPAVKCSYTVCSNCLGGRGKGGHLCVRQYAVVSTKILGARGGTHRVSQREMGWVVLQGICTGAPGILRCGAESAPRIPGTSHSLWYESSQWSRTCCPLPPPLPSFVRRAQDAERACSAATMGECLPGARPARYFSINYPDFSPRFTLPWRSPPSRPHCTAHLPYKVRCKIKQDLCIQPLQLSFVV